jgi:glucose dehydrogenase
LDEHEAVANLKIAHAGHVANIQNDKDIRESYLQSKDQAKANANGTTIAVEQSKRWTTKKQRQQGRRLAALKQSTKELVVKLHLTVKGVTTTWEEKGDLERVSV